MFFCNCNKIIPYSKAIWFIKSKLYIIFMFIYNFIKCVCVYTHVKYIYIYLTKYNLKLNNNIYEIVEKNT